MSTLFVNDHLNVERVHSYSVINNSKSSNKRNSINEEIEFYYSKKLNNNSLKYF